MTSVLNPRGAVSTAPRGAGRRRDARAAAAFLAPALALFVLFVVAPFVFTVALSTFDWDLLSTSTFVGFANFERLFADPEFVATLGRSFLFAFASVATHVGLGLVLAIAANRAMNRWASAFLRTAIFLPFLISWAATSLLWKYVLDPSFGIGTYYLQQLGIDPPLWFTDPAWALPAVILIDLWHTLGFTFVLLLAGLQTVPLELQESARTDGASNFQVFRHVTLPLMSPTIFFAVVITFIGAFQVFEPIQIITRGGPNGSTKTVMMYLYEQGFEVFNVGYASAVAMVVFLVVMAVTALQFAARRRWVHES